MASYARLIAMLLARSALALRPLERRAVLSAGAAAAVVPAAPAGAAARAAGAVAGSSVFAVVPDSSLALAPRLSPVPPADAIASLARCSAVFLGEHHNSKRDHELQAAILVDLRAREPKRPMAVGFEAVQRRFQPALDAFSARAIGLDELKAATEWEARWTWPFENYAPVFEAARDGGFELLALNADGEDLGVVEASGLEGLAPRALAKYVPDRAAFASFSNTTAFREYVAYVIAPSYRSHKAMGILRQTISGRTLEADMPFRNFYGGRMLWDNSMASAAAAWTSSKKNGLLVGVVGADHVKFGGGVPNRYARLSGLPLDAVRSAILNPSPVDSAGPGLEAAKTGDALPLTLQLRYAAAVGDGGPRVIGGDAAVDVPAAARERQARPGSRVLPLADLLWLSPEGA